VILVAEKELQGVVSSGERHFRFGLTSPEMQMVEVVPDRLIQWRNLSVDQQMMVARIRSAGAGRRAIDGFVAKIQPGSAALLYFSGFGIQSVRQSYLILVDAQIWSEPEVKRDGVGVDDIPASDFCGSARQSIE
jgi:hypothetical protein